ncbi:hypothetical protein [uncultured Adlercreutzia sp.]|uniref:hypothetical protein n=1 Tax=uncultured Adlercreutzia sp. TaxID=875803 RepID=UPI0026F3B7D6|nr:hypothetical protein [uncultured Adlercreutzia sp.]
MSCHNIGEGLNTVVKVIIDLYDKKEIGYPAAKQLIYTCRKAVNWCDGNEYEAVACIYETRCGNCLKPVEEVGELECYWFDDRAKGPDGWNLQRKIGQLVAHGYLCKQCMDEIIAEAQSLADK